MRNYLLLVLSVLVMSSCATKKYGCGLPQPKQSKTNFVHLYRGYGEVCVIDTFIHPYVYLIRTGGVIIKNGNTPTQVKYVIVREGKFTDQLKNNIGKVVYFECKSAYNLLVPTDMFEIVDGCVEQVANNFVIKDGSIILKQS